MQCGQHSGVGGSALAKAIVAGVIGVQCGQHSGVGGSALAKAIVAGVIGAQCGQHSGVGGSALMPECRDCEEAESAPKTRHENAASTILVISLLSVRVSVGYVTPPSNPYCCQNTIDFLRLQQ